MNQRKKMAEVVKDKKIDLKNQPPKNSVIETMDSKKE
jgi:hypothetical protein